MNCLRAFRIVATLLVWAPAGRGSTDWLGIDDGTRELPDAAAATPPFGTASQLEVFGKRLGYLAGLEYKNEYRYYHDGVVRRYEGAGTTTSIGSNSISCSSRPRKTRRDGSRDRMMSSARNPASVMSISACSVGHSGTSPITGWRGSTNSPSWTRSSSIGGPRSHTTQDDPDYRIFQFVARPPDFNPNGPTTPSRPTRFWLELEEDNLNLRADITVPGEQTIGAGYLMANWGALDWLEFSGGVRYETTDLTWDIEETGTSITLSGGVVGERLVLVSLATPDEFLAPAPEMNLFIRQKLGKNWDIRFTAKNLLDPAQEVIQTWPNAGEVVLRSYRKGLTFGLSVGCEF